MSALDTVERNEEGFLVNPTDWTKEIALEIAQSENITDLPASGILPETVQRPS